MLHTLIGAGASPSSGLFAREEGRQNGGRVQAAEVGGGARRLLQRRHLSLHKARRVGEAGRAVGEHVELSGAVDGGERGALEVRVHQLRCHFGGGGVAARREQELTQRLRVLQRLEEVGRQRTQRQSLRPRRSVRLQEREARLDGNNEAIVRLQRPQLLAPRLDLLLECLIALRRKVAHQFDRPAWQDAVRCGREAQRDGASGESGDAPAVRRNLLQRGLQQPFAQASVTVIVFCAGRWLIGWRRRRRRSGLGGRRLCAQAARCGQARHGLRPEEPWE
mmetsp:Transcript_28626/g.89520  ORF Transcript_28626/g.89520 Transcript_28626/m.89520 type:complete len:278 (+) Transcript_28626:137-970(+)